LDLYQSVHHQDKAALDVAQKLISHLEEQFRLLSDDNDAMRTQLNATSDSSEKETLSATTSDTNTN
jgi:hypothetical protein